MKTIDELREMRRKADAAGDEDAIRNFTRRINAMKAGANTPTTEEAPKLVSMPDRLHMGDYALGLAENVASMPQNFLATAGAGLMGIGTALNPFTDANAGDTVRHWQDKLSYKPQSEGAKAQLQGLGELLAPVSELEQGLGNTALEKTGSPLLATVSHMGPELLATALGAKLPMTAAKQAMRVSKGVNKVNQAQEIADMSRRADVLTKETGIPITTSDTLTGPGLSSHVTKAALDAGSAGVIKGIQQAKREKVAGNILGQERFRGTEVNPQEFIVADLNRKLALSNPPSRGPWTVDQAWLKQNSTEGKVNKILQSNNPLELSRLKRHLDANGIKSARQVVMNNVLGKFGNKSPNAIADQIKLHKDAINVMFDPADAKLITQLGEALDMTRGAQVSGSAISGNAVMGLVGAHATSGGTALATALLESPWARKLLLKKQNYSLNSARKDLIKIRERFPEQYGVFRDTVLKYDTKKGGKNTALYELLSLDQEETTGDNE